MDVQSTARQRVIDSATMDALPSGRNQFTLGVLIPGVTLAQGGNAGQDVGGAKGPDTLALLIHGSRTSDQKVTQNGVPLSSMVGGGWGSGSITNPIATQEITIDTSGVSAELSTGGVRINLIPREGGNTFRGTVFGAFATEGMQSNNLTNELKLRGLRTVGRIQKNWDVTPGFGGPIKRDKVWFFVSGRYQGANNYAPSMFYNLNANDPTKWTYQADESRPAINYGEWKGLQGRVAWQAAQKHKVGTDLGRPAVLPLPRRHHRDHRPRSRQRPKLPGGADGAGRLDLPGLEQTAARGVGGAQVRPLGCEPPARPRSNRSADDFGDRAGRRHPGPDLPLGGAVQRQLQPHGSLALRRLLHHWVARHQGRLQRRQRHQPLHGVRHPTCRVPVSRRHPEPDHAAVAAAHAGRGCRPRPRPLRPGQVDHWPDDHQLRHPLRPLLERVPGADAGADVLLTDAQPGLRRARQPVVARRHAEDRLRLRPGRQREDGAQGQLQQIPPGLWHGRAWRRARIRSPRW